MFSLPNFHFKSWINQEQIQEQKPNHIRACSTLMHEVNISTVNRRQTMVIPFPVAIYDPKGIVLLGTSHWISFSVMVRNKIMGDTEVEIAEPA